MRKRCGEKSGPDQKTQTLIDRHRLDLRIRTGYAGWGKELDREKIRILHGISRIGLFVAELNDRKYFLTPAGAFPYDLTDDPDLPLGIDVRAIPDAETFRWEIENQLRLRAEMEAAGWRVPENARIVDFDPDVGVITVRSPLNPKVFEDRTGRWYVLPSDIRTIPELLFALYGRKVPPFPDVFEVLEAPPWTIRHFGRPEPALLIDLDESRGLVVYRPLPGGSDERTDYILEWNEKTWRLAAEKGRPTVREAFREVFGLDLSPEMTREDVEAIIALRAIGS